MSTILYAVYALASLVLVGWGYAVWRRTRRIGTFLIVLVTLGVAYDNLVLALGNALGAGPLLWGLSILRFAPPTNPALAHLCGPRAGQGLPGMDGQTAGRQGGSFWPQRSW